MVKVFEGVSIPGKTCPPLVVPMKGNTKLAGSVILGIECVVPLVAFLKVMFSQYQCKKSEINFLPSVDQNKRSSDRK